MPIQFGSCLLLIFSALLSSQGSVRWPWGSKHTSILGNISQKNTMIFRKTEKKLSQYKPTSTFQKTNLWEFVVLWNALFWTQRGHRTSWQVSSWKSTCTSAYHPDLNILVCCSNQRIKEISKVHETFAPLKNFMETYRPQDELAFLPAFYLAKQNMTLRLHPLTRVYYPLDSTWPCVSFEQIWCVFQACFRVFRPQQVWISGILVAFVHKSWLMIRALNCSFQD